MIKLTQTDSAHPVCPHCEERLGEIFFRELKGTFGRRYIYFCSKCHKSLGVSHRKGFWMG